MAEWTLIPQKGIERGDLAIHFGMPRLKIREQLRNVFPAPRSHFEDEDDFEDEDNGTLTFTVSLSQPPVANVTVDYATTSGTATSGVDFSATSGTLSFSPGVRHRSAVIDSKVLATVSGLGLDIVLDAYPPGRAKS